MTTHKGKCPKCKEEIEIKSEVLGVSEVAFINNLPGPKEAFNAGWKVKENANVIRMLAGHINKLVPPYKITVKVETWDGSS